MTKQETVKWLIRALSNVTDKNSKLAWRLAGSLESLMLVDGHIGAGVPFEYNKKPVYNSMWVDERKEYYPELILRKSLEFYIK
jgi:hypothetical protein